MPYPFLSDEWLEEARRIRAEYEGKAMSFPHSVRMNLVVTQVPFGDKDIDAHMDTSSGELVLDSDAKNTRFVLRIPSKQQRRHSAA